MVWSFRLGGFLFFRVLKTGKDGRFDEMRASRFRFSQQRLTLTARAIAEKLCQVWNVLALLNALGLGRAPASHNSQFAQCL